MAQQFYQEPDYRRDDDYNVYNDAPSPSSQSADVSRGAQRTLDDIDDVLRDAEGGTSQKTSNGAEDAERTSLFNKDGDAAGPKASGTNEPGNGNTNNLFNNDAGPKKSSNSLSRFIRSKAGKRTLIGGGIAGVGVGGAIGMLTIFSGPFEFIHLAQNLQQFHFSAQEDAKNSRLTRAIRYIREPNKPENTRLGILGNKFADTFETKMNSTGIKSTYSNGLGYRDGYAVDRGNDKYKGKSAEEIKQKLTEMGVPEKAIQVSGGAGKETIRINTSGKLGYVSDMRLSRAILKEAGYNKLSSAIGARQLRVRAGVTFHPIKKIDQKINQSVADYLKDKKDQWAKNRSNDIKHGSTTITVDSTRTEVPKDANGEPDASMVAEQDKAEGATNEVMEEGSKASQAAAEGDTKAVGKFKATMGKTGAGALGLVGVACVIQGLSTNIDNIRDVQVIEPMMRMGMSVITVGQQVMNGADDIDLDQLGFLHDLLVKKNEDGTVNSTFDQARSYQAEQGQNLSGPDIPQEGKVFGKGNPFDFLDGVKGLGAVCSGLMSPVGQVVGIVFSGGPISAVLGVLGGFLSGPILEMVAGYAAGAPIDPFAAGADFGNFANYGARLAANDQALASGGVALSDAQTLALKSFEAGQAKTEFQSQSFAYRLFNPYDSHTMVAQVVDSNALEPTSLIATLTNGLSSFGNMVSSSFSSLLFTGKVKAADTYDYGFPKYGYSTTDLESEDTGNPYKNATNAVAILEGPDSDTYIGKVKECFSIDIAQNGEGIWGVTTESSTTKAYSTNYNNDGKCTDGPIDTADGKRDWKRIRMFIMDTETMEALACYEGDGQSCDDIGFNGSGTANDTDGSAPVSGTTQELAKQILDGGRITLLTPLAKQAMEDAAAGRPSAIESRCGTGKSNATLNPTLLGVLISISQKHTLGIGYITNGCHSAGSAHYEGRAVDINAVDGREADGDTAADRAFMHEITGILPDGSGMGQVQCSSIPIRPINKVNLFNDSCNHIHIQVGG